MGVKVEIRKKLCNSKKKKKDSSRDASIMCCISNDYFHHPWSEHDLQIVRFGKKHIVGGPLGQEKNVSPWYKRDDNVQLQNNKIRGNNITSKCKTVTMESNWRQLYRTLIIVVNEKILKKNSKCKQAHHTLTFKKKKNTSHWDQLIQ